MLAKSIKLSAIAVFALLAVTAQAEESAPTQASTPAPAQKADEIRSAENASLVAKVDALAKAKLDVADLMSERSLGKDDAPVTLTEFSSFTCSHCGDFYVKTFPELKKRYIDTGIVKFIYKDMPLDRYAFNASLMSRCADKDKYFDLVETIFHSQRNWLGSVDSKKFLLQLAGIAGVDDAKYDACTINEEYQQAMMKDMTDAQAKYKIDAVPALVFNDGEKMINGFIEIDELAKVIDELAAKAKKNTEVKK